MKLYEFIANSIAIVVGGALIAVPNGLVGMLAYGFACMFTDTLASAALLSGVAGVIWAELLFGVIMPLPFPPFRLAKPPFMKMLGWYIAFGLGFGLGPLAVAGLEQMGFVSWPVLLPLLCSGGLPLVFAAVLTPLGIVGFPNRKFD